MKIFRNAGFVTSLLSFRGLSISHSDSKAFCSISTSSTSSSSFEKSSSSQLSSRDEDLFKPLGEFVSLIRQQRPSPLVVGISAPQGCGKTTLTRRVAEISRSKGTSCVSFSIDDFYLTGAMQEELARSHPNNPLLQYRGNAGSHDIGLMQHTLQQLKNSTAATSLAPLLIPRYDKARRAGRGDRCPPEEWTKVDGSVDIALLEGWMLGFRPIKTSISEHHYPAGIVEVNQLLAQYKPIHDSVDVWVLITIQDPSAIGSIVYDWRLQAEKEMRIATGSGMTDEQVIDFVSRYMPAYDTYFSAMCTDGPQTRDDVDSSSALESSSVPLSPVKSSSVPLSPVKSKWTVVHQFPSVSEEGHGQPLKPSSWGAELAALVTRRDELRGNFRAVPVIKIVVRTDRSPVRVELLVN